MRKRRQSPTAVRMKSIDTAVSHRKTRQARALEVSHDYVEAIADLIQSEGEARLVDIARCLGVSHVTANRTVARLQRDGLVITERYRSIFLTEQGQALAQAVRHRHSIVFEFLKSLGVSEQVARLDAEGMEHYVSDETLRAFEKLLISGRKPISRRRA